MEEDGIALQLLRVSFRKMGGAIRIRYLMYIQLGNPEKDTDTSYNIWTGLETTKTNQASAYAQLWDSKTGDVVWKAVSNAKASSSSSTSKVSDNPEEYIEKLAEASGQKL